MTSPPSPPNRRRRRIVVVTIAVLVLGLGWWFWPRVDQRFVGTWYVTDASLPAASVAFSVDGFGYFDSGGRVALPLVWWVDGDALVIETIQPWRWRWPEVGPQADRMERMFYRWIGSGERWTVVTRADGDIEMHSPTPGSGRVIRRLDLSDNH